MYYFKLSSLILKSNIFLIGGDFNSALSVHLIIPLQNLPRTGDSWKWLQQLGSAFDLYL